MSKALSEIKEIQKQFDLNHSSGNRSLYIDINENNLQDLEHLAVCLAGEVGEFCNILKKMTRGDLNWTDSKKELSEELADVFIYLIKISNQANIDIETETIKKIEKNRTRFKKKA